MPRYISADPVACAEWKEAVRLLRDRGTLAKADKNIIAAYVTSYSRWRAAEDELAKLPLRGVLLRGPNGVYQNPLLHVATKALETFTKLGGLLGLDPATRHKMGIMMIAGGNEASGVSTRDRSKGPPPPGKAGTA